MIEDKAGTREFDINPALERDEKERVHSVLLEFLDVFIGNPKQPSIFIKNGEHAIVNPPGTRPIKATNVTTGGRRSKETSRRDG